VNQTQAFNAAAKLLGVPVTKVGIRKNPDALTGDERLQAIEDAKAARAAYGVAKAARSARHEALLAGDAEYQTLKAAAQVALDAQDKANARAYGRRITILRCGGVFNVQEADGDNFADAIEELKRKKAVAA